MPERRRVVYHGVHNLVRSGTANASGGRRTSLALTVAATVLVGLAARRVHRTLRQVQARQKLAKH